MSEQINKTEIATSSVNGVKAEQDANLRVMQARNLGRISSGAKAGKIVSGILVYAFLMNFYKKQISLLLDKCRDEVKAYMEVCKQMAKDFEDNLNAVGKYICYKDFVEKLNKMEKERDTILTKCEWHKRKIETILRNLNHFNDYIKGVQSLSGDESIDLDDFTDDAEHTDFYQMKLFVKGK